MYDCIDSKGVINSHETLIYPLMQSAADMQCFEYCFWFRTRNIFWCKLKALTDGSSLGVRDGTICVSCTQS